LRGNGQAQPAPDWALLEAGAVQRQHVLTAASARIECMAAVHERFVRQFFELLLRHAGFGKGCRQSDACPQLGQRLDAALGAGFTAQHLGDMAVTLGCAAVGHVEAHHLGQAKRIGQPMMQAAHTRQGMRERVTRAQAFLKGNRAHHGRFHHVAPRLEIVAMCDGSIHLFSTDMEVEVVTALLSRNGDEIINANDWQ
jgi:hypothetical protein